MATTTTTRPSENDKLSENCGCRIEMVTAQPIPWQEPRIVYCPTHAHADAMLTCVQNAAMHACFCSDLATCSPCEARAILLAVEG